MTLRDRLRARQLPTAEVRIPADPVAYRAAEQYLAAATRTLQLQQVAGLGFDDLLPYRGAVESARAAVEAQQVETISMRCLPVEDWEALVAQHPPTAEQGKQGWQWNVGTFRPVLLAACVIAPDGEGALTEMDWRQAAIEGQLTAGELDLLFATAVNLNARQPDVSVGKGSTQTGS